MKAIYITGFMGSGKTTIGLMLGELTGLPVYDSDQEVERSEGKPISQIFADKGEIYFRQKESEVLKTLPVEDSIVTVGGGTVLSDENRQWMNEKGTVIYLDCDIEEIERRLQHDTARPLIAGDRRAHMKELYQQRLPIYLLAPVTISTTYKSAEEVCREIVERIKDRV
ncbi:shikimate kinase [Peribacillus deserti]|uniref:Shikimate kinase n=1 Tax=Peribacillus deserti TaxID=673318 RepID=A0A2N5M485_9BACI|nr:shikimate kinase [Peribacillus deserti]PLT29178.1 shikimate kinase [Peribacillus deserti]